MGSTFGFSMPGRAANAGRRLADAESATLPVVVVVEDDRPSLDLVSAYLDGARARGHRARATASQALARSGGCARRGAARHPAAAASTAGRC